MDALTMCTPFLLIIDLCKLCMTANISLSHSHTHESYLVGLFCDAGQSSPAYQQIQSSSHSGISIVIQLSNRF